MKAHPLRVYEVDGEYYLTDGGHRLTAAEQEGWTEIGVIVIQGTWSEARDDAALSNADNPWQLTPEEKVRAAVMLKEEHFHGGQGSRGGWDAPFSYDYIAERLGFPGSNAAKLAVNRFEKASLVSNDTSCSNVQTAA